jgi:hypothetical protein
MLRSSVFWGLLAGALTTLAFELHAGQPSRLEWWLGGIPFTVWVLAPFGVLGLTARSRSLGEVSLAILLAASVLLMAVSVITYNPAVMRSSSTAGLVFLFVPMLELIGLIPFVIIALVLKDRGRAR